MRSLLQARGEGLCPVNTECTTDSLVGFLEREGYTDIRVIAAGDKPKKGKPSEHTQPAASRPARRTVTRRPRT